MISLPDQQKSVCQKFCAEFLQCDPSLKIGISRDFDPRQFPINGLRHPPEESMAGWYLWSGEDFSEAADFFAAIHVWHIHDRYPELSISDWRPAGDSSLRRATRTFGTTQIS